MNNLKLQNLLLKYNRNSKLLFKLNQQQQNIIIRLNNTTTTTTTTPNNDVPVTPVKKKYPHGIDLKNVKSNKGRNEEGQYRTDDFNYSAAFLLGTLPCIAFYLGVWQIRRRDWKLEKIAMLESRTQAQPIELPTDVSLLKTADYEYLPIKVRGHFDHGREVLLTIRQDTTGTYNKPGAYVITPFVLADRDLTILVNRGFVPYTNYSIESRKAGQIKGDIDLIGLNRHNEVSSTFSPLNKPHLNEWHQRDVDVMAVCLDTAPVFLDATYEMTPRAGRNEPIGPVGGQTIVNLRNEHLTYIVTWFTLSAITAFMWGKGFGLPLLKKLIKR